MSVAALSWALTQDAQNPTRKLVLITLANYANDENDAWPSVATIAHICGVKRRSVQGHLRDLVRMGLVTRRDRVRENGSRSTAVYTLRLEGGVQNMHGGGATQCTGGVQPSAPPEPTEEPCSLEKEHIHESVRAKDDFERVWAIHRRGPKPQAREAYQRAVPAKVSHEDLAAALLEYTRTLSPDFAGAHLFRWIRDERWEEMGPVRREQRVLLIGHQ